METIRLGKTGMMVSRIGFGGIPIQRLSEDEAVTVVKRCLDLGVTYIDTANGYTTSEERIGKAVAGRRDKVFIATKSGALTPEAVGEHLKLSLKRLDMDYIDLYQFHNLAEKANFEKVMAPGGAYDFLKEQKKAGVIRHIGVTSHSLDLAIEMAKSDLFETIMFPFNFMTNEAEAELIPLCRQQDIGFIVMKPFAGGALDNATMTFKHIFQFPDILPIPGIEKPGEIEEIVGIWNGPHELTEAEKAEMARMRDTMGNRFCRRCQYCQPCTVDIPITTVMTADSFFKRMARERFFSGNTEEALTRAADCTQCGLCETRCPYQLPIMEMMSERADWYQREKKKFLAAVAK